LERQKVENPVPKVLY